MTPTSVVGAGQAATPRRPGAAPSSTPFTALLWVQGLYYLVTGVWPLVSVETFQMVTGPKTDHLQSPNPTQADHWLLMTVGVLITSVALTLLVAAWRHSNPAEAAVLAMTSALALTAID